MQFRPLTTAMLMLLASIAPAPANESAPAIRVTLLGTGTPALRAHRSGPATLVEAGGEVLLFDAGRGTTTQLGKAGIVLQHADKLFLTHLHSDHITGVPDLLLTGWVLGRRNKPLQVWGPDGTQSMMANLAKAYQYDIWLRSTTHASLPEFPKIPASGAASEVVEISEGVVYRSNGVTVTAFEVDHNPIEPAFGFRVDYAGHAVVMSGDTRYSENLIKHARGTDVLIHEVAYGTPEEMQNPFRKAVVEYHTSPTEAGQVFEQVKPRLAVFSHIITSDPADDAAIVTTSAGVFSGDLVLGRDLMAIEIDDEVTVFTAAE